MEKFGKQLKLDSQKLISHKNQGLKNARENSSRKTLNSRTYKKLLTSWMKVTAVSAESPQKGDKLSREGSRIIKTNGSGKCAKRVVESSFSPLKKQRVDFDSKKRHSRKNAESDHKDGLDFKPMHQLECGEKIINDVQLNDSQLNVELDENHIACFICMLGGELLCCDGNGCNRSFHLSCIDPPFSYAPPGVWHCLWCVQKKVQFGVHSVSEGFEYVLDARELDSDKEVGQRQKEYMVKYRGLAHVHSRWIPEQELKETAPSLLLKYKKLQGSRWETDWALPHRLLQKRPLYLAKQCNSNLLENDYEDLDCHNEWLVKWKGLGYDNATWELESASFLKSPEAAKLMRDFESRQKNATPVLCACSEYEEGKIPLNGMSEFQYKAPSGLQLQDENNIDKLRRCWYKRQNSVVVDNEERIAKVVLFVLSLKDNKLPFLVIASYNSLSFWEAEFSRHESSNIVVYEGNTDVRASIRYLEFYSENGSIMFQILLSPPDIVVEDLRILEGINWGGIIVDECQLLRISQHLNQIKALTTNMRLLILNDHIKDCGAIQDKRALYDNLLSFISTGFDEENGNASDSDNSDLDFNVCKLKERLARFLAYECDHQTQRFLEFWVPVQLSNVQLEQYCAMLLSKSKFLSSSPRIDFSNSLHELLISEKKCCNHPYLMDLDHSLRRSLTGDLPTVERLNAEINMSGKLQLLEKFLLCIREQGLRVLIVFQPFAGPGTISTGDVLDDFVLQRFGKDSYVRIDGGEFVRSRKQAALNLFNNEGSRQFVFLLERRACLRSIKLSSVDTVILFDSDWNPLNDIRALQKITIRSQLQQLKVFRLYSTHTLEEKVLMLAKEGVSLDHMKNINQNTCHMLLTWGALHLFQKLDHFHGHNDLNLQSSFTNEHCFSNEVLSEFSGLLPNNKQKSSSHTSIITKAEQTKGAYAKNVSLHGEVEADSMDNIPLIQRLMHDESSNVFWKNLLKGRHPRWKLLSSSFHQVKSGTTHELQGESQPTEDAAKRKHRMVNSDSILLKSRIRKKRRLYTATKDCNSADLGRPSITKSKSLKVLLDIGGDFNTKIGPSLTNVKGPGNSKTIRARLISRNRGRNKGPPLGRDRGQLAIAASPINREQSVSELTGTRLNRSQTHILLAQGCNEQEHQVPIRPSIECPTPCHDIEYSSVPLPAMPAPTETSLDAVRLTHKSEPCHSSQNMATILAFNSQLPQNPAMQLEEALPSLLDPLQRELEKMQKDKEHNLKIHDELKLRLKAEFKNEIAEVTRKYVKLLEDEEKVNMLKMKDFEMNYEKVYASKLLAEAVVAAFNSTKAAVPGTRAATRSTERCNQNLANHFPTATNTTLVTGTSFSPSPSVHFSSNTPASVHLTMPTTASPPVPPPNTSPILSFTPVRPINKGGNIRPSFGLQAPAPHLRCSKPPAEEVSLLH